MFKVTNKLGQNNKQVTNRSDQHGALEICQDLLQLVPERKTGMYNPLISIFNTFFPKENSLINSVNIHGEIYISFQFCILLWFLYLIILIFSIICGKILFIFEIWSQLFQLQQILTKEKIIFMLNQYIK